MKKPKVAVLFTGGTISMTVDEQIGAAIPTLSGHEILSMVSNIDKLADIEIIEYGDYPGPHIDVAHLMNIRRITKDLLGKEEICGVIITHGTDSLEESAYFLDLMIRSSKPVILVGAMRNSSELGYDGPSNLAAAVCTAISPKATDKGVLVVLNNEVNAAREVMKTNTLSLNTFHSPYGPIGSIDTNDLILHRTTVNREYIDTETVETKVVIVKSYIGMDSTLLRASVDAGMKGIVIEAMGRGNLPPHALEGVEYAIQNKVTVVVVSRCPSGRVMESYGYHGGGKELSNMGVILGGDLTGQKARIKLMIALGKTSDISEVRSLFEKDMQH